MGEQTEGAGLVSGPTLEGRRVVVVGGSAGIGRAFALRAIDGGARVVVAARRADRLAEVVATSGGGATVAGDVTRPADCERIAREATRVLEQIDLVLVAVGAAPLRRFADFTTEDWRHVLDTNVVGVHQVVRATLPSLAPGAIVAALSSEDVAHPRAGLVAYGSSKAALEVSMAGWRVEHPAVRFSSISVGATQPTDFGESFDLDLTVNLIGDWCRHGLMQEEYMDTDDVASVLLGILGTALAYPAVGLEHLSLRSPSPVVGTTAADDGRRAPGG